MSLQLIAKQMESKGRNGDSVLVHMTPGEVAGLQKLAESAGGSLSVNPETGLVEANFLKQMLPTLVGVGVGMVAGPWAGAMAGAAVGGYQAKRNDQDMLTGALMGGIGGYGGGTMGASLGAAGQSGLQQAAMQEAVKQQATAQTANIANTIGTTAAPETAAQAASRFGVQLTGAPSMATTQAAPIMGTEAGGQAILNAAEGAGTQYNQLGFFDKAKAGFSGLETQAGREAAMAELGGTKGAMKYGLMALSPALNAPVEQPQSPYPLMSMDLNMNKGAGQGISAYEGQMPSYSGGSGNVYIPTFRAADGGSVAGDSGMSLGGLPNDDVSRSLLEKWPTMTKLIGQLSPATLERLGVGEKEAPAPAPRRSAPELRAYEPEMPQYTFDNGTYIPTFRAAEGGLASLAKGGMKDGGFVVPADVVSMVGEGNTDAGYRRIMDVLPGSHPIKGEDGGQSDTVKTSIEGKQPAAVAHGEVYVPPEAVKKAGGAKRLYAMMDRVREQATGSKQQIKPVRLESAMA